MSTQHAASSVPRLVAGVAALVLVGCTSVPPLDPIPEIVAEKVIESGPRDFPTGNWWAPLEDETLDALIATGLAGSPSPRITRARLGRAETEYRAVRSTRWPAIFASGSRDVRNVTGQAETRSDFGIVSAVWDVGLWGRRGHQIDGARAFREARLFEHLAGSLALSTTIAETYYEIVELGIQTALLDAQLQVSQELETFIEARFRLGQAPANELYQQREQTAVLAELQIAIRTRLETLEKRLDSLLGEPADGHTRVTQTTLPAVPAPASMGRLEDLARYRPDIRANFELLKEAAAHVGLRIADRLPTLNVTVSFASLADKAASTEWVGHALDLSAPIFAAGRLKHLEENARFRLEEERARYVERWLNALEEVETYVWEYQQQQTAIATLEERRSFAQQALDAARTRYTLGDQNYLDVLTALRGLQEADRTLVNERRRLVTLWIRSTAAIGQPVCQPDCSLKHF